MQETLSSALPRKSESAKSLIHTGLQPGDLWQGEIRETVLTVSTSQRTRADHDPVTSAPRETVETVPFTLAAVAHRAEARCE